jgi:hypothetical protein
MEAAAEFDAGACFAGFVGKALDERAPLDDEVGVFQRKRGEAAVGEKFKAANFVNDAVFGGGAEQIAHAMGDDQSAFGRLQIFDALENADGNAFSSEDGRREKARSGTADDGDASVVRGRMLGCRVLC